MTARRVLLALGLIGPLTTCAEPTSSGGSVGFGGVAVRAVAPPSLAIFAPTAIVEQAKVSVRRVFPQQETFVTLDSALIPFKDDQNSITTDLKALVAQAETLEVLVEYQMADGTNLWVAGSDQVVVRPGATVGTPVLQPFYVGPGGTAAFMSLSPADSVLSAGDALTFDPTALDANQQPVGLFYVSWATDDPRIPINARGKIVAPNITKLLNVTGTMPNGVVAQTTVSILGSAALGITPDSVEKLPGGTQLFTVTVGALRTSQFVWSVNGVDGGDAQFGTINVDGFYTAPATTPSPNEFKVCARDAAAPTLRDGCATVVISAVPSVGTDVIVINDQNIFDEIPMANAGNVRFVRNLLNFSSTGPRASGKVVWYDRGRNSPCFEDQECGDSAKARLNAVIEGAGYSILKLDSYSPVTTIPADVKVIVLWMPLITYSPDEINALKRFAGEGGRILFIGEHVDFYGQAGIDLENQFLAEMGSQMVNLPNLWDCQTANDPPDLYFYTPSASLRSHPLLNGVTRLGYVCAAEIQAGPNDFPLFYDTSNQHLLAAVAKIDLTPLPAAMAARSVRVATAPSVAGAKHGTGRGARN